MWYGAPNGNSIIYNLAWLKNFSAQLAQGDLYPRWLMSMNHGAGSPVFYYYAPLPFYIASIPALILAGSKLTVQLAWGEWLLIALSGAAFFHYARRRYSPLVAWVGAVLYMVLPYHYEIDLWRRQDIGELTNYIWMPLVLYYTEALFADRRAVVGLALCYALMLVSHLPSTLLFSLCLGAYVLVLLSSRDAWRYLGRFAGAIVVALLLTGIYWVPALFSEQYIRTQKLWTPYFDFHRWFFSFDEAMQHDSGAYVFSERLFRLIGMTTMIFAVCWLAALRRRTTVGTKQLVGCLVLIGLAWFLMSSWSTFVWEHAPELWKVQFPWRIAMVVDLATAIAVLHALRCLQAQRDWLSGAALIVTFGALVWCFASADVMHTLDPFDHQWWVTGRDKAVRNGLDAPEYTTAWNPSRAPDTSSAIAALPRLVYAPAAGGVGVVRWSPHGIVLQANLRRATLLQVRQFYFPNWRARIENGAALPVAPAVNGLLTLRLPPGHYRVVLRLAPLRQAVIGAALSVVGIVLLCGCVGWRCRHRIAIG